MDDWRTELDQLEAALEQPGGVICPGCRLALTLTAGDPVCPRCNADLSLLAGVHDEAQAARDDLYRAALAGDSVTALSALDAVAQLTGPTPELAVLRHLLRGGLAPLEVLEDLRADRLDPAETLAVYREPLPLAAALEPDLSADPVRQAFADLLPADEAAAAEDEAPAPEDAEAAPEDEDSLWLEPPAEPAPEPVVAAAPPPPVAPGPWLRWLLWALVGLAVLWLGVQLGLAARDFGL